MMRVLLAGAIAVLFVANPAPAQEKVAEELVRAAQSLERGSLPWFVNGFERVEAELAFDVERATRTASELEASTSSSTLPGVASVASAYERLARATLDGPANAPWNESAVPPPRSDAPHAIHAYYHLARSRYMGLVDQPNDELSNAFGARESARAAGDPLLRMRAAWQVLSIVENQSDAFDAELAREIDELALLAETRSLTARHRLTRYWRTYAAQTGDERQKQLDEVVRIADELGDVATLARVSWERGVLAEEAGDIDGALARMQEADALAAREKQRRVRARVLEIAAAMSRNAGRLAECERHLDLADELTAGRGYPEVDVSLGHARLRLAMERGDSDAILKFTSRMSELRRAEAERHQGFESLCEQLLSSERARLDDHEQLKQELSRSAENLANTRRVLAGVGFASLALLALFALHSRRKLLRSNARLRDEMKRAEDESLARRALEERMRLLERSESLGLVASGVAHDFNNLLVGVVGNAELLRHAEDDPERARRLDAILGAGERATRLCSQLQTYAGGAKLELDALGLDELVRELTPVLTTAAGANVELAVESAPSRLVVDGDRTQLEQVLLNLVANARDANARHVRLATRLAVLTEADLRDENFRGEARPGEFASIEVSDDGEGMSRALIERIFDPFFTTRFPGRGLGLAVVFGAVRRHSGFVSVTSAVGEGTRFRVYLPLRASDGRDVVLQPQPSRASFASAAIAPMRVIVVDDERDVREYVRAALTARGHEVAALADGSTQLRELVARAPRERTVALVDLSMPVVDGRDVVRELRSAATAPAIVLMSGHSSAHLADTARELGVDGFIAKPFTAAELERVLASALDAHAKRCRAPSSLP